MRPPLSRNQRSRWRVIAGMILLWHIRIVGVQVAAALGLTALFACPVQAQTATDMPAQVERLRAQIKAAADDHADPRRMGHLWWQLGVAYQNEFADGPAEDAYARAIPLLRSAGDEAEYADAMYGLGCFYANTVRSEE